jgi:hypothetical protein
MIRQFSVGDTVRVVAEISLDDYATIRPGEIGDVVEVSEGCPDDPRRIVHIRLVTPHVGLRHWDNCLWLIDGETDTILSSLELVKLELENWQRIALWLVGQGVPLQMSTGRIATCEPC